MSMEMSRKKTRRPGDTLAFEIALQPCLGESFLPSFSDFRLDRKAEPYELFLINSESGGKSEWLKAIAIFLLIARQSIAS